MDAAPTFIIADNQDITRAGLRYCIARIDSAAKVTDVSDKQALVAALKECGSGIVILDYALFDLKSADELLILSQRFPAARWLLFSHELSENLVRRLSGETAVGMILKENSGEEINTALKCALAGERFLCHQITNLLLTKTNTSQSVLTPSEVEILRLIAQGKSVKEIAAERHSSIHTIITHKKNIFRKIEVNNIYEATKYALRAGLVEMMEYYI